MKAFMAKVCEKVGQGGPVAYYLRVDDVDAHHEQAVAMDAVIVESPWDAWWGLRQYSLADPEGNWWTVNQPVEKA